MKLAVLRIAGAMAAAAWCASAALAQPPAPSANTIELGSSVPDAASVSEKLFPKEEEDCEKLQGAGFKCMGFAPSVRYSLPATSFKLGSAELPDGLKRQLDIFAEVLKAKKGSGKLVRIEGHADASGTEEVNLTLSQRRAEAVKDYLVSLGADPSMLTTVGEGARNLKNPQAPFAAENRRVEIGRQLPGS